MRINIFHTHKEGYSRTICIAIGGIILFFLLSLYDVLFTQQRIFSYDSITTFGIPRYFYNSLDHWIFPYWDPYEYCGQPFYYHLGMSRIFDPISVFLFSCNKILNGSYLLLYHCNLLLRMIIAALGVYACLRATARYSLSSLIGLAVFLFSTFTIVTMRQAGNTDTFLWVPWILWSFLRVMSQTSLRNIIACALFFGLSATSYTTGYLLTFMEIFILTLLINQRKTLKNIFDTKQKCIHIGIGLLVFAFFSLQAISILVEKGKMVEILREFIDFRSPLTLRDFAALSSPNYALTGLTRCSTADFSEGIFYIGIMPLLFALIGICFSKHNLRLNFLILLTTLIFIGLDAHRHLGALVPALLPFLAFTRHGELFQPFIIFMLVYFVSQGIDVALDWSKQYL